MPSTVTNGSTSLNGSEPTAHAATNGSQHGAFGSTMYPERDGLLVPETDMHGYRIRETPMGTKARVKVILMGAGASSLDFFKKAESNLSNVEIVCYEKNADIGGTWLENRYPGCACDIPSVNYQYSWALRTWTHFYSYSPEIWQYLKNIEVENNFIEKYIKLQHKIEHVEWDSTAGLWRFKIRDLKSGAVIDDEAQFFLNAGGVLNTWRWPTIEGLESFQGKLMHSARYEEGYNLEGKRVAVIGAGSSGVQIVAAIQKKVEKLYHWVRSPIWVLPGFAGKWAGKDGANFEYSEKQKKLLEDNPQMFLEYRKQMENELNQRFKFIIKGSETANLARENTTADMYRRLKGDPRLVEKIIPKDFNPGCRRPTPAPGYLEALIADNTTVFTENIKKITPTGFVDQEGRVYEVDVIICATGFDTSWKPAFPFVVDGKDLRDTWAKDVTSYLSIGVPEYPNYFMYCGAYGPLAHGSFMPLIEKWTDYIMKVIEKAQVENIKSLRPRSEVAKKFRQHADLFLKRTAWTSPCSSWFKQGKVEGSPPIYPGSRLHFFELLKNPRFEDFAIEYWDENQWAFLGNGFDVREFDGRDITYYLGSLDNIGADRQPVFDETLIEKLAGWAIEE